MAEAGIVINGVQLPRDYREWGNVDLFPGVTASLLEYQQQAATAATTSRAEWARFSAMPGAKVTFRDGSGSLVSASPDDNNQISTGGTRTVEVSYSAEALSGLNALFASNASDADIQKYVDAAALAEFGLTGYRASDADLASARNARGAGGFSLTRTYENSLWEQGVGAVFSTDAGAFAAGYVHANVGFVIDRFDGGKSARVLSAQHPDSFVAGELTAYSAGGVAVLGLKGGGRIVGKVAAESATVRAARLGAEGEQAVGLFGPKVGIRIPGANNLRFPDNLTTTALTEVKNVASQGLTKQLRDYITVSQSTGRTFDLYVRPSTRLTSNLEAAILRGDINLKYIPGAK